MSNSQFFTKTRMKLNKRLVHQAELVILVSIFVLLLSTFVLRLSNQVPFCIFETLYLSSGSICLVKPTSIQKSWPAYKFPIHASPDVSLLLLTYNDALKLKSALVSLSEQKTFFAYELIIIDNGCYSDVRHVISKYGSGAKYLPLCNNPGYSVGNNRGVSLSSKFSSWILFLNDDLEFQQDFLHNMIDTTRSRSNVGAVGCKILSADGSTLLEAGSIVWRDGSCWAYGRDSKNLISGEFSYVRPVDYISGACLLVRKQDFLAYGGYDFKSFKAYYEDTDLCMHISHTLGKRVWFQPGAVAKHSEHSSFGKNNSKFLMEEGQLFFQKKWESELKRHHKPDYNSQLNFILARDARRESPSVLYVDQNIPRRNYGSGFGRAYDNLQILSELDYKITALGIREGIWGPSISTDQKIELESKSIELVLPTSDIDMENGCLFLADHFKSRPRFYSVIIVSRPLVFELCLSVLRENCFNQYCVLVYDAEALWFRRDELLLKVDPELLSEATKAWTVDVKKTLSQKKQNELQLLFQADIVISVSLREQQYIQNLPDFNSKVYVIGHTMEPRSNPNTFDMRRGILFTGMFNNIMYYNGDALLWFLNQVYVRLNQSGEKIPLLIAGRGIPGEIIEWVERYQLKHLVTLIESPPSIQYYFDNARLLVAPHLYATGTQYKVSEAAAEGLPCVISAITAEGLGLSDDGPFCVGTSAEVFLKCVQSLYFNQTNWARYQKNSLAFITATHNRSTLKDTWKSIMSIASKQAQLPRTNLLQ